MSRLASGRGGRGAKSGPGFFGLFFSESGLPGKVWEVFVGWYGVVSEAHRIERTTVEVVRGNNTKLWVIEIYDTTPAPVPAPAAMLQPPSLNRAGAEGPVVSIFRGKDQGLRAGGHAPAMPRFGTTHPRPLFLPAPPPAPIPAGVRGLKNLGNSCYLNASVQCLAHLQPLASFFAKGFAKEANDAGAVVSGDSTIADGFAKVIQQLWAEPHSEGVGAAGVNTAIEPVAPERFKELLGARAPQFLGHEQHDAQVKPLFKSRHNSLACILPFKNGKIIRYTASEKRCSSQICRMTCTPPNRRH